MKQKFIKTLFLGGLVMLSSMKVFSQTTTVTHDFNDNIVPTPFRAGQGYFISASEQRLKVKVDKQMWEEFSYDLPMNLSAAPRVSFKVRGDTYFQIVIAFVSNFGTGFTSNRFPEPLLATIFPSKEFIDVSFDMSRLLKNVDSSKITSIRFVVDPAVEKSVNLEIDDFKVGSAAQIFPRMIAPMTQYAYVNQAATNVMLRGLTAGSTVTATSSNTTVVPHPTVGAIGANGIANLTYTPVPNQSGAVKINVRVSKAGMSDLIVPFDLFVEANQAPTINAVSGQTTGSNQTITLPISGITDGNTSREQAVTISGKSSDQTVIRDADISVSYTNPFTKGEVTFKTLTLATGSKVVNLILTLSDNGGNEGGGLNTKTVTVPITVFASYYKSPEVSPVANNNFAYVGINYTTTITGLNDGNGGNNVASVTAVSSNPTAVANPVVNYIQGSSTATLSYTTLKKDTSTITISVTNSGAPTNSNGNSTTTTKFTVTGVDPPYTGYIEDFQSYGVDGTTTNPNVLGGDYYTSGTGGEDRNIWMTSLQGYNQKWFIEGQGREQTFTLDPVGRKATIVFDKPASVPRTFAGIWYNPRKLFDLSNAKYLSIKISSSVDRTPVTFDILDVNDNRYGLNATKLVGREPTVYTFSFQDQPSSADLDFSKIAGVLINVANLRDFKGTITISELKIGDKAEGAPPSKPAEIMMSTVANRTILSNTLGYTVNLYNVFVTKDAIKNATPITLSVTSNNVGIIPTPEITNPVNGEATIKMKPVGTAGTATITVTAKAAGVADKTFTFTVEVLDRTSLSPSTVTINPAQTYQTISGIGAAIYTPMEAEELVGDMGASMGRFDIGAELQPGFEGAENDNSDPFVLDLSKFKVNPRTVEAVKKAKALGCDRFIAAVWTPPIWMKGVLAFRPQRDMGGRNRLLDEYYDEFAEYILGACLAFKNELGFELYSINLQNEAEFGTSVNLTATAQYTKEEAAKVVSLVYPRLREAGLSTRIHGFDQLPFQNNVLTWFRHLNETVPTQFDAFSIHAYDANAIDPAKVDDATLTSYFAEAQRVNPKKELWMTETSGWSKDAAGGKIAISSIFSAFANNLSVWLYFGLNKSDEMTFYVHKNFAKFIKPGAVRVGTTSTDVPGIAFNHAANRTFTVVLVNTGDTPRQSKLSGVPAGFPKMYAYMTAPNINTQLVDSVTSTDGYMVNLPPNSIVTLHSKFEDVTLENEEADVASLQMLVYPNPTKGEVNLILPNNSFNEVKVYDITGRTVMTKSIKANGSAFETLNLTGLQKGVYIISAKGDIDLRSKIVIE